MVEALFHKFIEKCRETISGSKIIRKETKNMLKIISKYVF